MYFDMGMFGNWYCFICLLFMWMLICSIKIIYYLRKLLYDYIFLLNYMNGMNYNGN